MNQVKKEKIKGKEVNTMIEVARLFKCESESKIKAYADVQVAGEVIIKGLRVIDGKDGLFVGMPASKNKKDGKYYDTVVFLGDSKEILKDAVLAAYNAE
ncbi:MAG TPA: septation protein spoVG [Candidatus Omnitrophica bacterium]|nr:septation protein spoVG [Candidatus Omnitrophota bacterium]